jgi:hypothetical protein
VGKQVTYPSRNRAVPVTSRADEELLGPLAGTFERVPVDLTTFVTDPAFLNNPRLSEVQYEAVRHLEQVYLPETYELLAERLGDYWRPTRFVNFVVCQWGKGSGKDHICRVAMARVIYLLTCLRSPVEYFGMPQQDFIHTLNVASSATQASRVFFSPLREMVKAARCFRDAYGVPMYQTMQGSEPGQFSMKFPTKHLECVSGHSGAQTQEGMNLILGIGDEISAFPSEAEARATARASGREATKTAEGIVKMMRTSAATRFSANYKVALISYPRYEGDAIQTYTLRGRDDNETYGVERPLVEGHPTSRWYVSGPLATWDVNPRVASKDAFEDDYRDDLAMAEAMYECRPGKNTNRFFRNTVALATSFATIRKPPPLEVLYHWGAPDDREDEDSKAPNEKDGWQVIFRYNDLWPMKGAAYALHGDMSINGDRAGVAMCHIQNYQRAESVTAFEEDIIEPRPVVKLDFATAFEADLAAEPEPREVQLRWFRKLVWDLSSRGFYIARVTMDGWQSADSLQILLSRGIEAERVSCDVPQTPVWNTLKDLMYDGRFVAYQHPLATLELASLMLLPNGKLDHPAGGSKDIADAIAGSATGAVEAGGSEGDQPERADVGKMNFFQTIGSTEHASMMPDSLAPAKLARQSFAPPEL